MNGVEKKNYEENQRLEIDNNKNVSIPNDMLKCSVCYIKISAAQPKTYDNRSMCESNDHTEHRSVCLFLVASNAKIGSTIRKQCK